MTHTDPTRAIAWEMLHAVLDLRRPLDDALDAQTGAEPRNRAAAHRLAAAVLRRMGSLDAVLEPFLNRAPPEGVRHALRLGAAGLLLLDTPAHAAVGTAVELVRSRGLSPFAGLVNAVLRRVAAAGPAALTELDAPRLDTPAWLWTSWGADARAIASAHAHEAPIDLTLRGDGPDPGGEPLPGGGRRWPAGTRVAELPGFGEGSFWVQDEAASWPARLLAATPGEHVADLCAAPGGKTAQLAAAGAQVFAVERDAGRLRRLHENLARLRLPAEIVQGDALNWAPPAKLDAVLLDAPCSATGTIRRHPDVIRLKRPRDVAELAANQTNLLAAAAGMLRSGGRLVYAVCSLQPEEGVGQLAHVLPSLRPLPFTADELALLPSARTEEGWFRTHPGMGMDGFFAARFIRR